MAMLHISPPPDRPVALRLYVKRLPKMPPAYRGYLRSTFKSLVVGEIRKREARRSLSGRR
jgi:hypothetical protein